jgi:hypothetical protein
MAKSTSFGEYAQGAKSKHLFLREHTRKNQRVSDQIFAVRSLVCVDDLTSGIERRAIVLDCIFSLLCAPKSGQPFHVSKTKNTASLVNAE